MRSAPRFSIEPLMSRITSGKTVTSFRKDQVIFSDGDPSDSVFYIQNGTVKLTVTSEIGREAIVAVLNGGSLFGENAVEANPPRRSSRAIALTDVRVWRIEPETMLRLIHRDPHACDAVISYLLKLHARTQGDLAYTLLYSSAKRLARALASLAQLGGSSKSHAVLKLSQQELAGMVGLTRQRVNVLMKQFRKSGVH